MLRFYSYTMHTLTYHSPKFTLACSVCLFFWLASPNSEGEVRYGNPVEQGSARATDANMSRPSGANGETSLAKMKRFDLADVNNDRRLSFAEFVSLKRLQHLDESSQRKLFVYLDQNTNNFIDRSELSPQKSKWMKVAKKSFSRLDQNSDGGLSFDEFSALGELTAMNRIDPEHLFKRLDRDGNGLIDRRELLERFVSIEHLKTNFMVHDEDASETVNYAEYSLSPMVSKWPEFRRKKFFERLDTNVDGELDKHELSVMRLKKRHAQPSPAPRGRLSPHDRK